MAAIAPIIVPATRTVPHSATIIFLHGLGDSGKGWLPVANQLSKHVPHVKWVLPTAPVKSVTMARGFPMNSWFDIATLDIDGPEDDQGIKDAAKTVENLIEAEIAAGIPEERIVVGGFSQGGATSLYASLATKYKIAGTIALSTWLPSRKSFPSLSERARNSRYFFAHGTDDEVVGYVFGKGSCDLLNKLGIPAEANSEGRGTVFKTYDGMGHSSDPRELEDILVWLNTAIPEKPSAPST